MSLSTAWRVPSEIRPIAMPAAGRCSGTPACSIAIVPPHTVAIDELPLLSVISDSMRIV
jgi:hypothetical protein